MGFQEEFQRLAIALGLGLIVGLQRERTGSPLGGFRTFPLVTMFGTLAGFLSLRQGGLIIAAGFLCIGILIIVGNLAQREDKPGITTEAAMLVMYATGALAALEQIGIAAIIGGTVAVLLHLKPQLHSVARRLDDPDFKAIMQFVLITLVVLPILPDRYYGPFEVLNPQKIWLMVVLIVGISIGGYIIYKFFGQRSGSLAGAFLGGLISSTATTVSYARRAAEIPQATGVAALIILVASTVQFVRLMIIMRAVTPTLLSAAAGPMVLMLLLMGVLSLIFWKISEREPAELPPHGNPSELKAALAFATLYAVILLAVAYAKTRFGDQGLYLVSTLSGLADMDAITLSVGEMVKREQVAASTGWRLIMTAAMSNLVFKTMLVAVLGNRRLLARIGLAFGISLAAGLTLIAFWPAK